jgi:hypothetical protein
VDAAAAVASELFPEDACWVEASELFPEDACWLEAQAVRTLTKPRYVAQAATFTRQL